VRRREEDRRRREGEGGGEGDRGRLQRTRFKSSGERAVRERGAGGG
jgi:hypothetical protein